MNKHISKNSTLKEEDDLVTLSKLRWHCRRGVKELDVVLNKYLEKHYLNSNKNAQEAFITLLKLEDPILMSLVMDQHKIEDNEQNQVLDKIKKPLS